MNLLLIVIFLIGLYAFYYKVKKNQMTKSVLAKLPNSKSLDWTMHSDRNELLDGASPGKKPTLKKGIVEGASIAAVGSIPSLYFLSEIDPQIMDAIDFAFSEDLSNFNHLHDYVNDHYFDAFSVESAEGWMTRLEGYVTEQHAAEILEKLGYDVEFPENANQAGYDLLVDGEPWQVKGGETVGVLDSHFNTYDDIPVVTSTELAEKYNGTGEVKGFEELNPELIEASTTSSIKAIDQLGDTMGMGIPVVTAIVSGYRELKLLHEGKTDGKHATKNLGLDIAGTGGGGLAGAKLGAFMGAAAGPAGFAVGGLIGGIAGAIGGKLGTNKIKSRHYRLAVEAYEHQVLQSKNDFESFQSTQKEKLKHTMVTLNKELNDHKDTLIIRYRKELDSKEQSIYSYQLQLVENVPIILDEIRAELIEKRDDLFRTHQRGNWLSRLLLPNETDIFLKEAEKWFNTRIDLIDQAKERFLSESFKSMDVQERYEEILHFFREHASSNVLLLKNLEALYAEQEDIQSIRNRNKKEFFENVMQVEGKIKQETAQVFHSIQEYMKEIQDMIQSKIDVIKKEKDRLGY